MQDSKKTAWRPSAPEKDLRDLCRKNPAFGTGQAAVHVINPAALEKRIERQLELEADDYWEVGEIIETNVERQTEGDVK